MRILLDECLPRKLKYDITGFQVDTVTEIGWSGLRNGKLLGRAEAEYDVLITVDRNMGNQQNIPRYDLALVV
ncbi:MAG: DUF5615 family PIN-like protein [Chloroflexia bacterium]